MPTILRVGPYRFFFYSSDARELIHVHIERDDNVARFWLDPMRLQNSDGSNAVELRRIQNIIGEYQNQIIGAWHENFSK